MTVAAIAGHSAFETAAFAALCFVLATAGGLAGLVLGNMRLPATVAFSDSVAAAGGANVAISAVAAMTASVAHIRAGRVNWRLLAWLAPTSLAGGFAGGLVANAVNGDVLLGAIAVVLFYGSYELFNWRPPAPVPAPATTRAPEQTGALEQTTGQPPATTPTQVATESVTAAPSTSRPLDISTTHDRVVVSLIGLVVGLLGGAVGLILGTLRMPALLRFTGEAPQRLVGSNLAAGVLVGLAGAIGHLTGGSAGFDTRLFVVGSLASAPGALLGSRLTGVLPTRILVRVIAWIVLVAAIVMAVNAVK